MRKSKHAGNGPFYRTQRDPIVCKQANKWKWIEFINWRKHSVHKTPIELSTLRVGRLITPTLYYRIRGAVIWPPKHKLSNRNQTRKLNISAFAFVIYQTVRHSKLDFDLNGNDIYISRASSNVITVYCHR